MMSLLNSKLMDKKGELVGLVMVVNPTWKL